MKKVFALLLALCLMLSTGAALADSVDPQLIEAVKGMLEHYEYNYDYDAKEELFELDFNIESELESVEVTIYMYDDMVSVAVDSPLKVDESVFEKMAIFITLANNEIYYGQFRLDRETGLLTCRSCNVIEQVIPSMAEVDTLLYMPMIYMEGYGDGIVAVCEQGADPYEAFEACQAIIDAQ